MMMVLVKKTNNTIETMDNFYDPKCGVFAFLEELGLSQYYEMFLAKGFDSEKDLRFMERKDLDTLCITDKEHRDLIISQASLYRPSEEQELYEWLRENMLDYYCINFLQSGRDSLHVVRQMVLPDEDIYDDLEIMLPGHRKRLQRAVSRLQKQSQTSNAEVEYPVAYGKWMKPDYLEYAKFDFLCVDATIFATDNNNKQEEVVFMVDSGSDVVTLRPELVRRLNLVKKCTIRSQGVHVAKEKTLYEAKLKIGSVELKIELIPEEYNSLGNRVFRHFRHYITGSRHVWLKGDFKDPSMEITTLEHGYEKQQKVDEQRHNDDSTILDVEPEAGTGSLPEYGYQKTMRSESNLKEAITNVSSKDEGKEGEEIQNDIEFEEESEVIEEEYSVETESVDLLEIEGQRENREERRDNIQNGESNRMNVGEANEKAERTEVIQNDESDRLKVKEGPVKRAGSKENLPLQRQEVFLPAKITPKQCFFHGKRSRASITSHLNKKARRKLKCND